jgi:hypothetical protein
MRQPVVINNLPWVFAFVFGAVVHLAVVETIETGHRETTKVAVQVDAPPVASEPACPVITVDREWEQSGAPPQALFAVRQLDDTHFSLARDAFDALVSGNHLRYARIVPAVEDGRVIGFKLFGIPRASPLGVLGFRNGDLVTHVNGQPLDSVQSAMETYSRLHPIDRIVVDVERNDESVRLSYELG